MCISSRLLSIAFSALAVIIGLFALPTVGESASLSVLNWIPPTNSSLAGMAPCNFVAPTCSSPPAKTTDTIPMWLGSDTSNSVVYSFAMVGKDPTIKQSAQTSIDVRIIPIRFTSATPALVFDPENNDFCSPSNTPVVNMVQQSPVFRPVALPGNLNALGTYQFGTLFQRANFASFIVKGAATTINPDYQVNLSQTLLNTEENTKHTIAIESLGGSVLLSPSADVCESVAMIDVAKWDAYLQSTIFPGLSSGQVSPTTLPIFLFSNVVMYDSSLPSGQQCCILGYHNAFPSALTGTRKGKLQTYIVANYDSTAGTPRKPYTGAFPDAPDIVALANMVAGWIDNPTTLNPTPPWPGTINGGPECSNALPVIEVSYPRGLGGSGLTKITAPDKNVYHFQDLAFKSWFYGDGRAQSNTPNSGFGASYSLFATGTFATSPASCP